MKSLIRFGITAGLIGTTIFGSVLGNTLKVLALPTEEILQKLTPVPVFTIADENGAPLVASGENDSKVAGVFISQTDANNFVQQLQQQKPEVAQQVKVVPVSLGEIYQLAEKAQSEPNGIKFAYVPMQDEVEIAKQLLTQAGKEYQGGVPLFVAKAGEEQGYLTVERNSEQVIPFFFEKEQLQTMLDRFKQEKPELASTISIEVIPLESIIQTLKNSEDEALKKIIFVPTEESLEFIRSNTQQSPSNSGQ